jgi:hypothetical protein
VFFVSVCMEVVGCSIVCNGGDSSQPIWDDMGYVIVWCGVWFDEDSTFVDELVCNFVANDSSTCSYILDSDSMWDPCH